MEHLIFESKREMGAAAAFHAARAVREAIEEKGCANIVLATGTSQFETLGFLVETEEVDWSKVTLFHLDEYIGIGSIHPASFQRYLKDRFVEKAAPLKSVYFIHGDAADPQQECKRLGGIIARHPVDIALVGIGENGHLAFNDPPADFETKEPFIVVHLDEACRRQQAGEGWFASIEEVPRKAISMSIRQIMKSRSIVASVPEGRKAEAVRNALQGEITNLCPASILQEHPDCTVFLDIASASLLQEKRR